MPELPEVQTVVTTLRPSLLGRVIQHVDLRRPDVLRPLGAPLDRLLPGRRVDSIDRRGKKIVFTLDSLDRFYVHLGMSGQLMVAPAADPLPTHTHLTLDFGETQLRFRDPRRFGGVWWCGTHAAVDGGLGPEPLTLRSAELARLLAATRRPIKSALLDQSVVAGLGNIYVDESLFAAGVHPLTPAAALSVSQIAKLNQSIKATLRAAIRHRGSTLRDYRDACGESGGFQSRHRVYHRAGQPCRKCGSAIERTVLGGRSTHWCPGCQGKA